MNQTPPISPVVNLNNKKQKPKSGLSPALSLKKNESSLSSRLQAILGTNHETSGIKDENEKEGNTSLSDSDLSKVGKDDTEQHIDRIKDLSSIFSQYENELSKDDNYVNIVGVLAHEIAESFDGDENMVYKMDAKSLDILINKILFQLLRKIAKDSKTLEILNLNNTILREQFDIEKKLMGKELEMINLIRVKKQEHGHEHKQEQEQGDNLKVTGNGKNRKKRKLGVGNKKISRLDSSKEIRKSEEAESDRTISETELDTFGRTNNYNYSSVARMQIPDDELLLSPSTTALASRNKRNAQKTKSLKKNKKSNNNANTIHSNNLDYDALVNEISENQKLFLHNKFGFYYNTLNEKAGMNTNFRDTNLDKIAGKKRME
ncbi:hypothetical protein PACTADRAFT_3093 [Pachysolen tannophilus NRRL Y-2460]|uniref:Uncharacterized protein n=1 Tax=Pachysolen tannophilus NRRL Y-2460 TaxID=669874 RepID=A0A1E4TUF0_PACTA|nr:hypothetical protein PACTADRAFT_3093 [Pachysolen tannophilus NRRL Y-2460]